MFKYKRLPRYLGGAISATIAAGIFTILVVACADISTSNWLGGSSLNLQKQANLSVMPPSWNGNIDCFQEDAYSCVIDTFYGTFSTTGSVKLKNTSSYRTVISHVDGRAHSIPIPPTKDTIINYTTEPVYGFYLYFTNNFTSSITSNTAYGSTTPQYSNQPVIRRKLADKTGHRLPAHYIRL